MKAPPTIQELKGMRRSEMDRLAEVDIESPEEPAASSLARQGIVPEHVAATTKEPKARYSLADIQGDRIEALAEGDFIESLEQSSNIGNEKRSARNVLLAELTGSNIEYLENQKEEEVSPTTKNSTNSTSLRDLTTELILANAERDSDRKGCDGVTRGTASDRMAEAAGLLFSIREKRRKGSPSVQPRKSSETVQSENKATNRKRLQATREHIKESRDLFVDFIQPRKRMIFNFWWIRFKWLIVPGTAIAFFLFFVLDNPPHGKLTLVDGKYVDPTTGTAPFTASVSWWVLFVAVRQVITFSSAEMWELLIVDFLVCKTGFLNPILGPYLSLWIAQSKGWPFRAVVWGVTNYAILAGSRQFPNHWGYFQDTIHLFNGRNPSGNVLENPFYTNLIYCCIAFGGATAAKRAILSNLMGKRLVGKCTAFITQCSISSRAYMVNVCVHTKTLITCLLVNYGEQLERLMKDVLLVTRIAVLSRKIAKGAKGKDGARQLSHMPSSFDSPDGSSSSFMSELQFESFNFYPSDIQEGLLSELEEWDEPELLQERLLKVRKSLGMWLSFIPLLIY
jgi:hypothetical protein